MNNLGSILLVEDNPMDAELIMEALSDQNLSDRVVIAKDGVEALEYLQYSGKYKSRRREHPAVVLLDIKMPRLDGTEVLQVIRNDDMLKHLPVVMLTSSREQADLKRCYKLGANAYIVKPVDFEEFTYAIKQAGIFWAVLNELPADIGV